MNKVFKIVFNAARGMRMVVNETTSSVQSGKKAAVMVAVIGALASGGALAASGVYLGTPVVVDSTLTVVAGDTVSNYYSGKTGATIDVQGSQNNPVTFNGQVFSAYWPCGGSLGMQGFSKVTLKNVVVTNGDMTSTEYQAQGAGYHQNSGEIDADGLVVKGNKSAGPNIIGTGATLFAVDGIIKNSEFSNNTSKIDVETAGGWGNNGGGLFIQGSYWSSTHVDHTLTIANTTFKENEISGKYAYGGGLFVQGDGVNNHMHVNLDNVTFEKNVVSGTDSNETWGGAIGVYGSSMTIKRSTFEGNTADGGNGGAIGNVKNSSDHAAANVVTIENSVFTNNQASDKGGAIYNAENATINFVGINTFSGNTANGKANDIYNNGTITLAEGSVLSLAGGINGEGTVEGTGSIVITDAGATIEGQTVADTITASATGDVNDALGGNVSDLKANLGGISVTGMAEGSVMGAVSMVGDKVKQQVNKKTEALAEQVTLAPQMITRIMMNDVRKRMGDLRAAEGTHGVWARYNGGQMAGSGMEADFNMVQVGVDTVPVADAPRFGVAFSYAQTEADATNGLATTDMDSFSLAFYGTKMYDNGMFVDVIGRVATMDTEMTVAGNKAEMDNVALSLSGELGWRFDVTDQFFIEPSAELTYTYTNADTFTMGRGTYELESVDSLVGRAGFAAGFKCPADKGDVYVRAAVVHEFMGDSTMNSMINGRSATPVEMDGEDTYFEYAVGAQFNVNKNTYVYADLERTEGANVDEDWRANVGVRFAF